MLYLLLEEDENYLAVIDQGYSFWKFFSEFEAAGREEALTVIPTDRYGKYRLYEIKSRPVEITVQRNERYEIQVSE